MKRIILLIGLLTVVACGSYVVYQDVKARQRIDRLLSSEMEACREDGRECWIEYHYDADGLLLYGEVLGK